MFHRWFVRCVFAATTKRVIHGVRVGILVPSRAERDVMFPKKGRSGRERRAHGEWMWPVLTNAAILDRQVAAMRKVRIPEFLIRRFLRKRHAPPERPPQRRALV